MSGIGAKLSRHVLGMKFMRKTKDQIDKERVEKVHREHFAPSSGAAPAKASAAKKNEESSSKVSTVVIEEVWSYNQCERYIFGRQSFGGFNPLVEKNVKKGIWRPFYLDEAESLQIDSDDDEGAKKKQSDVDVSDEEMAKTYGSLVGTLAKHFRKKHKKDKDAEAAADAEGHDGNEFEDYNVNEDEEEEQQGPSRPKKKKWNKKFQRNKNKDSQGGQRQHDPGQSNKQGRKGWKGRGNRNEKRQEASRNQQQQQGGKLKKSPFSIPGFSQNEGDRFDGVAPSPPNKRRKLRN